LINNPDTRQKKIKYYPLPDTLTGWCCIDSEDHKTLWLSCILSKEEGKGNFRRFLDEIEAKFDIIKVPTPSKRMIKILIIRGYLITKEYFPKYECEGLIMIKHNK